MQFNTQMINNEVFYFIFYRMIIDYLTYLLILSLNLYISYCIKKILVIFIMGRFRKKNPKACPLGGKWLKLAQNHAITYKGLFY